MTTILCGLPAFQPMHQPGFPAPAAGDKSSIAVLSPRLDLSESPSSLQAVGFLARIQADRGRYCPVQIAGLSRQGCFWESSQRLSGEGLISVQIPVAGHSYEYAFAYVLGTRPAFRRAAQTRLRENRYGPCSRTRVTPILGLPMRIRPGEFFRRPKSNMMRAGGLRWSRLSYKKRLRCLLMATGLVTRRRVEMLSCGYKSRWPSNKLRLLRVSTTSPSCSWLLGYCRQ